MNFTFLHLRVHQKKFAELLQFTRTNLKGFAGVSPPQTLLGKLSGAGLFALSAVLSSGYAGFAQETVQPMTEAEPGSVMVPVVIESEPGTPLPPTSNAPAVVFSPSADCSPTAFVPCPYAPVALSTGTVYPTLVSPGLSTRDYFFCGAGREGIPTTFVNTLRGNVPIVRWVSNYFVEAGYSPTARCRDVSARFNRFYEQGRLNFVTTGIVNGQPVVCVASFAGGPCTGTLFTLKSSRNANRTIQQLFSVRAGTSGPLYESEPRMYIDLRPYTQATR